MIRYVCLKNTDSFPEKNIVAVQVRRLHIGSIFNNMEVAFSYVNLNGYADYFQFGTSSLISLGKDAIDCVKHHAGTRN